MNFRKLSRTITSRSQLTLFKEFRPRVTSKLIFSKKLSRSFTIISQIKWGESIPVISENAEFSKIFRDAIFRYRPLDGAVYNIGSFLTRELACNSDFLVETESLRIAFSSASFGLAMLKAQVWLEISVISGLDLEGFWSLFGSWDFSVTGFSAWLSGSAAFSTEIEIWLNGFDIQLYYSEIFASLDLSPFQIEIMKFFEIQAGFSETQLANLRKCFKSDQYFIYYSFIKCRSP